MEKSIETIGLETIIKRIDTPDYCPFNYTLKIEEEDFRLEKEPFTKYVRPFLSVVEEYSTSALEESSVILIEAVGAAGKSALTRFLSLSLHCPIYDLGRAKVVGTNSLNGLLSKRMQRTDCAAFLDNISAGRSTLLIDALDEGYLKTNNQGYLDFLEDVLSIEPKATCPLFLLGRYNAIELAASFLAEKEVRFVTLQIEPFMLSSAREFIDKCVESLSRVRFEQKYKETRDYILEKIGGFFKNQSSIKDNASARFIGYAPVLQSIAALFDERTNYQLLLDELKNNNIQSVALIIDIIERILRRDREQKVHPVLKELFLNNRSEAFRREVLSAAYSDEEQCARILYKVLNKSFPDIEIKDPSFLSKYNESIHNWIEEHPFMGKKQIGNVVFESYILAKLIDSAKYQATVYDYLKSKGVSYMFVYIYDAMYGMKNLDKRVLPFIYNSLRELNNKQSHYTLELVANKITNDVVECVFCFSGSDSSLQTYSGSVTYQKSDTLDFGEKLEYLVINVPLDFYLSRRKVDASAPSYINCKSLCIESEEFTVYGNIGKDAFVFECDDVVVIQSYDQYLHISGSGLSSGLFKVISPNKPDYPVFDYWTSESERLKTLDEGQMKKYKKLRSIILEFRSHSKSELAKYYEKIDFINGSGAIGQNVISALKRNKIMYQEGHLYKLNDKEMALKLGLSYDGFRNFEINKEIVDFLKQI